MTLRSVLAIIAIVLAAGCSGSSPSHTSASGGATTTVKPSSTNYADVTAVHDALTAHGIDCADFKVGDPKTSIDFGPKALSTGDCTYLNEKISIEVYKNAEVRDTVDGMTSKVVCSFAKSFGIKKLTWVSVANWTAAGDTSETAQAIKAKMGGSAHSVTC